MIKVLQLQFRSLVSQPQISLQVLASNTWSVVLLQFQASQPRIDFKSQAFSLDEP